MTNNRFAHIASSTLFCCLFLAFSATAQFTQNNSSKSISTNAAFNTAPNASLIIGDNNSGNIGIRTINPEYPLDVRGNASVGADLIIGRYDQRPQKSKLLNRAMVHFPGLSPDADNLIINFAGDFEDGVIVDGPGLRASGLLEAGGSDIILGRFDGRPQKSKLNNRAMVHLPALSPDADNLIINYAGDFEDGVIVDGPGLRASGLLEAGGSDIILGRFDGRPQKSKLNNRALIHFPGVAPDADNLIINYTGDFEDGVIVDGPGLMVGGAKRLPAGYRLAVGGKVICEELKVQLQNAWPDYVFESNYVLPSLEQVEQQIKTNKHLPGIPSACELEADGLSVGEMQTKMMEKIEELTLYLIDLKKENTTLRQEIDILKQK